MRFEDGLIERALCRFETNGNDQNHKHSDSTSGALRYDIAVITDIVMRLQTEDIMKDDKLWTEWTTTEILEYLALDDRFAVFKEYALCHRLCGHELGALNAVTLRVMGLREEGLQRMVLDKVGALKRESVLRTFNSLAVTANASVPKQYLDPISYELMTDPVMVTVSGYSYQRSVIEKHIANYKNDPFSRQYVSSQHLVENRALKECIAEYVKAEKARNGNNQSQEELQRA